MEIEYKAIVVLLICLIISKLILFPNEKSNSKIFGDNCPNRTDVVLFIILLCLMIVGFYLNENPLKFKL